MKDLTMLKKGNYTGILEDNKQKEKQAPKLPKKQKKTPPKKQQGRPQLNKGEKRTELVKIYLTQAERKKLSNKIAYAVEGFKIPESQFLRKILIDNDLI
jgi:hypothetical protein